MLCFNIAQVFFWGKNMRKKLKIKFNKIIALLVLSTFLLNLSSPVFASINIETSVTEENKQIFNTLVLPYSYGQITKSHYAGSDRVIINIQDLHCHPKVQKNISSIIELFDKQYGVKNIYLEGVYGEADTSWLADTIKNDKSIAEKLLETGRLTGAEYYSAVSGKTKIIKGLEQKEEYLDNLKRFGAIVENQDRINLILEGIRESSEKIKAKYYDKRQYKLEKLSAKYKEGKITAEKYYTLLNKHIDRLGIDIYKYENTLAYIMLLSMQRELNYKAIMKELQSLLLLFKERLPYDTYMALFEETEGFARADKLQEYIIQITKEYDFDLSVNFKSLDKHLRYLELSRKINPIELVKEEQELSKEINTRFSQTKAQRDVVFMMYFEKYLRDYLNSSITADDYEYYQENIGKYKELWSQYVDNRVLSLLDEYMLEADKFYKINDDRNTYFADFISDSGEVLAIEGKKQAKDDTSKIIANMDEVKRLDIIVTGGFHTDTVSSILKDKGISYIVITPNVKDGAKEAEETYYEIAKEQGKISFQTLATLPLSLYGQEAKVRISVEAFGEEIAKEIFGEKQVRDVMSKPSSFTQDEQNILSFQAQRRQIEFAKILDSDDEGEVSEKIIELVKEYISEDLKDKVNADLLAKANPVKLEEALSSGQQELDNLITLLDETNPIKKLILSLKATLKSLFISSSSDRKPESGETNKEEETTYSDDENSEIISLIKDFGSSTGFDMLEIYENYGIDIVKPVEKDSWFFNLLDFLGIKDSDKKQKIENILGTTIIILGLYAPFKKIRFLKQYKDQESKAKEGAERIFALALFEADSFLPGSGIKGLAAMLTNKDFRQALNRAYSDYNRQIRKIGFAPNYTPEKLKLFRRLVENKDKFASEKEFERTLEMLFFGVFNIEETSSSYDKKFKLLKKLIDAKEQFSSADDFNLAIEVLWNGVLKIEPDKESDIFYSEKEFNVNNFSLLKNTFLINDVVGSVALEAETEKGKTSSPISAHSMLMLDVLFSDFNFPKEDIARIENLMDHLGQQNINKLALENNALGMQIFFNHRFQELSENISTQEDTILAGNKAIAQYRIAVILARMLYLEKGNAVFDLPQEKFDDIIEIAYDHYSRMVEASEKVVVLDENTYVSALHNYEENFRTDGIDELLKELGIYDERKVKHFKVDKAKSVLGRRHLSEAKSWLRSISDFSKTQKELGVKRGHFVFNGHGEFDHGFLWFDGEGILAYNKNSYITSKEIVDALLKAKKNGTNLEDITLDLSTCHSWYIANDIYKRLAKKGIKELPQIITEAGFETQYAYTIGGKSSNLNVAILDYLKSPIIKTKKSEDGTDKSLTLTDVHKAIPVNSNHTVFVSNTTIQEINESFKGELDVIVQDGQISDEGLGRNAARNIRLATLQTKSTVEKLDKIEKIFRIRNFRETSLGIALGALMERSFITDILLGGSREDFLKLHTDYVSDIDGTIRKEMLQGLDSILASMKKAYNTALKFTHSKFIAEITMNIVNVVSHYRYNKGDVVKLQMDSISDENTFKTLHSMRMQTPEMRRLLYKYFKRNNLKDDINLSTILLDEFVQTCMLMSENDRKFLVALFKTGKLYDFLSLDDKQQRHIEKMFTIDRDLVLDLFSNSKDLDVFLLYDKYQEYIEEILKRDKELGHTLFNNLDVLAFFSDQYQKYIEETLEKDRDLVLALFRLEPEIIDKFLSLLNDYPPYLEKALADNKLYKNKDKGQNFNFIQNILHVYADYEGSYSEIDKDEKDESKKIVRQIEELFEKYPILIFEEPELFISLFIKSGIDQEKTASQINVNYETLKRLVNNKGIKKEYVTYISEMLFRLHYDENSKIFDNAIFKQSGNENIIESLISLNISENTMIDLFTLEAEKGVDLQYAKYILKMLDYDDGDSKIFDNAIFKQSGSEKALEYLTSSELEKLNKDAMPELLALTDKIDPRLYELLASSENKTNEVWGIISKEEGDSRLSSYKFIEMVYFLGGKRSKTLEGLFALPQFLDALSLSDIEIVKSCLRIKYSGLSDEIMDKIINKLTSYSAVSKGIKAIPYLKRIQNKVAFILLNSVSKEEMKSLLGILSDKDPDKINSLFGGLAARSFRGLAADNNAEAIKLFFDDNFNNLIDTKISESDDFRFLSDDIARYHTTIAISRMMVEKGMIYEDMSEEAKLKAIEEATTLYFKILAESKGKKLIGSDTVLMGLFNNEDNGSGGRRFNPNFFLSLLDGKKITHENTFAQPSNDDTQETKKAFLKATAELNKSDKKYYILFLGHGSERGMWLTEKVFISPEEIAKSLWQAHKNGVDLRNITLDLSACYSYYYTRNLYDALKEMAAKENKESELTFPTVITAAGLETELGYTLDIDKPLRSRVNLHDAMKRAGIHGEISLFDLISMEYLATHSNSTMFFDTGEIIDEKPISSEVQYGEKRVKRLPWRVSELSILKDLAYKYADNKILSALNKTAPIWEEIIFRGIPTIITLINPFVGIPVFLAMQPLFVFSHTIVKWLVNKDSSEKSFKDFVKEDFSAFAPKTVLLSLPYIAALFITPFSPFTIFPAFFISVIIHAINNYSVKTDKQEGQIKKNRMPLASFSPLFILTAASIAVIPSIKTDEKGKEDSMAQIDDYEKESILKKFHNMRKNEKMKKLLMRYFQRANINIDIDNISQEEFIGTFNNKSSENDKKLLLAVSDDRMLEKFLNLPEDYQENIERVLIKNNKHEDSAAVYNLINNIHYVLEVYGSKYRELDEDKSIEKKIKDLFTEDTGLIFETEEIFQLLSAYAIDEKKSLSEINTLYLKFKKLAADKDIVPNHYIYILKMFLKYGENSRVFDSEVLKRDVDEKALKYLTDLDLDEKIMCELLPLTDKIDPQIYELLASSDNKYKEVWNIIEKENLSTLPKRDLSATSKFITIVYLFGGENSRTVRSFYATNDAEFLSKYADIKFVKSCLEIKYPGMSEEIMSKIIEQVTSYYELEFYTNEEKNRNRMAFMFLNSVSEEDMKTLLKIVPGKDFDKVRELFIGLAKRSYRGLATDNDMAPIKLFFDDDFNKMLDNKMRESKDFGFLSHEISRYHTAIAISRMAVEKGMSQEEATEQYFKILFEIKDKKLIDQDTVLIGIYNNEVQEDGKMRFGLDSFEKIIGRTIRPENKFFQSEDSPNAKGDFLNTIAGLNENDKKYYILFKGHGLEKEFRLDKLNSISPEEMAQALWQVHKNGIDLRNVTLDLGSCYSYYFARNLYKALKQKAIAEGQYEEINYPTIIAEAGRETEFGYTVDINIEGTTLPSGNFHNALWKFNIDMEEGVSLGALIFLERLSEDSNYTIFVDAGKNNIAAFKRQDEEEGMPLKVIEFSILKPLADKYADNKILSALNKTAPVWEEILFRAIPATLILINPFIGIPVFMLMQPLFIFSHTIVRWLVNKDSSGMSLKELAKENFGIYAPKTALLSFSYLIAVPLAVFSPFFIPAATSIAIIAHAINNSASFSVQTEITEEVVSSTPPDTSEQELESSQQSAEAAGILLMKTFNKYYTDNNNVEELINKDTMSYFSTGSSAIEESDTNEIKAKKQERINIANINKDILDKAKAAGESFSGLMPKKVINALNNLFAGTFSEADSKTIHEYVFENEAEREVRESWIKMFAVLYAYKTWTEQGIWKSVAEDQKENGAEVALSNGIKLSFKETFQHEQLIVGEEIILPNGLKLTFERWIHMCDAHSILTNGNVEDANRYADAQEAFNGAIKLEDLIESVGIINEIEEKWDAIAERVENRAVYMKKANNNKPYCLVVDKTNNTMDTLFVIGKAKYENVFKTSVEILIRPGLLKEGEGEGEVNVNVDVDTVNNIIKQGGVFIRVRTDSAGNMQGTSKYEERKNEINKDEAEEKYCIGCDNSRFLFAEDAELYKRIFALDFPYRAAIYKAIHKFDLRVIGVTSDNVLVAYDEGRKSIYLWDIGERRQGDKICKLDRMKRFSLSNSISINVSVNGDKVVLEFKDRNREEIKKIKEIKGTDALNFDYNQFYNTIMDEDIISQGIYTLPITDIVVNSAARSITPSNTAQEISIKIVKGNSSIIELENNIADMSKNLIITENEMSAQKLKGQGFEAVTARVVYERGGEQIGQYNGMNVRAKWNEDKTEILLCLKSLDADVQKEELLRMLVDTLKEGRENNILYGVTQIVITNEQTVDGAIEAIKNTHTDSYMDAIKETKFDLSERNLANNIQTICERESAATGTHIFVMNLLQAQQNQQNILKLKDNGFKFVVSYSSSEEAKAADEILHDGAKVDASDIKNIKDAKDFLFELKDKALKVGAGLFLSVKFNDDIYKDFVEEDIDIFDKYGIIPIVSADSKYLETSILGRMEVEEITEENVDQILENDIVVSIVVDDARVLSDKKEKLKQVKTKEQKYNKGYNASLSSKFDYTTRDIVSLSELLTADINDEESNLKTLWESVSINEIGLSQDTQSYIKYLLERERYEEALGFIRGVAMNSAEKILIDGLADMQIAIKKAEFKSAGNGMFHRAMHTLLVQLLMEGDDINSLLQDDYVLGEITMTAKEYLELIMVKVNKNAENILKDNEYKIKKLSEQDHDKAVFDFQEFNLYVQDKFRERDMVKNVKVSALAVRSILGAA